jgi:hypothetical protein
MTHYFFRLIPPRPTFAQDLTETEAQLMQAHAVYWRGLLERGQAVAFGLVADPQMAYGVAVVELDDDADPHAIAAKDPTILADAGFSMEVFLMPRAVVRPLVGGGRA